MNIPAPYEPYEWADNLPLVYALKALHEGKATDEQQRLVINGLMGITAYYDLSYRPNSERDTSFAEGKRFVGSQIVKMINLTSDVIEKSKRRKQTKK